MEQQQYSNEKLAEIYNTIEEYMKLYWEIRNCDYDKYPKPISIIAKDKIKHLPNGQELFNLIKDKTTENDDAIKLVIEYYEKRLQELVGNKALLGALIRKYQITDEFTQKDVEEFIKQYSDDSGEEPDYGIDFDKKNYGNLVNEILDRHSRGEISKEQRDNMLKEFASRKHKLTTSSMNWYQKSLKSN